MRSWHLHPFYPDVAIGQWCDRFIMLLKRVTRFFFRPSKHPLCWRVLRMCKIQFAKREPLE